MLSPDRLAHAEGFGFSVGADGYRFRPTDEDGVREAFDQARKAGKDTVLRGAGMSYGDASILAEGAILDLTRMRRILGWDPKTGIVEAEGGATLGDVWRTTLEDGWWLPVTSGTMAPTLAGALAMNVHGKNHPEAGTLGEHVRALDVVTPNGEKGTLTPEDPAFRAVVSGAGLLGAITRVELQMRRVASGDLRALPVACRNWDEQFEAFERFEGRADFRVTWIDAFARGKAFGRGQFHAAWYGEGDPASLRPEALEPSDTALGFFPKSSAWRLLKAVNHPFGIQTMNGLKMAAARGPSDGKPFDQSLIAFNYQLDYVPHWRRAYEPGGMIQHQSLVPRAQAPETFARMVELCQDEGLTPFLAVMKRHRADPFLLSYGLDGYSLALDFKVTPRSRDRLWALCHRLNDLVVEAHGRFYLAKDATLRPEDYRATMGPALDEFARWRDAFDPDRRLSSELAKRLGL